MRVVLVFFVIHSIFAQKSPQELGDYYYGIAAYAKAVPSFELAIKTLPDSTVRCQNLRKLAACYEHLNLSRKELQAYKQLVKDCKTELVDLKKFAASLTKTGDYEKAARVYQACYLADTTDTFSLKQQNFCLATIKELDQSKLTYCENLYALNSNSDDILCEVLRDSVVFLSSRKNNWKEKRSIQNNQADYNLFKSHMASSKSPIFLKKFNNSINQGVICSNIDQTELYLTTQNRETMRLQLSLMIWQDTAWSSPSRFNFDNDSASFSHPSISPDGKMLFFVSDMKGGFGGTDIYVCIKKLGKWSAPINLGKEVNTASNELFPSYYGEGILFFSSNGREGYGGYDIYKSRMNETGWSEAQPLPLPINSKMNDISFRFDKNKPQPYLSSDRSGGKGAFDIYSIKNFDLNDLK